ncbi:Protein SODIUM POTASSIUM ROOT DEFECTIVE 1, partial [Mucuna pruriens]
MKGMYLLCSSTAVTSSSIDHDSMARKRHASIRRKSQLCVPCASRLPINPNEKHRKRSADKQNGDVRRKNSVQVNNLYSSSSTRYLLSDWVSESDKIPSHKPTLQNQVVVLRVSLHCKACEGKLRKHISKMEGVTSFSIDMEAKKVTIIGHVTPLGVLASVSKVKNAQLWPSSTSSSSSSLPSLSSSMSMYVSMVNDIHLPKASAIKDDDSRS